MHRLDESLKKIIATQPISDQKGLQEKLAKAGIEVNQSSVSRSLKRIGAVKTTNDKGKSIYQLSALTLENTNYRPHFKNIITDITANEQLIIVKTTPGSANFIGRYIDQYLTYDVLGTIAGDDTILVIPISHKKILKTIDLLQRRLY